MKETKDLIALVERDKLTSEKLITLSWEDSDWHEVLQMIGDQVAQLEADNERLKAYADHTQICPAQYDRNDKCMCGFAAK